MKNMEKSRLGIILQFSSRNYTNIPLKQIKNAEHNESKMPTKNNNYRIFAFLRCFASNLASKHKFTKK
ncbi:MAG: hypothetical protein COA57_06135 [Flavobacteriales bacterium]|nr:MAG: hypothetical protein COA57_06135 [Flavobacteriales bacterium]